VSPANILGVTLLVILTSYLLIALIIGRFLAYHDLFLRRKQPDGAIELKGYDYIDVVFQGADQITLKGWFIKSKGNQANKTLFLIPGWTRTRSRYLSQIKFFVDAGFHVFTYDQRSHGASGTGRISYGPKEGADLLAAIDYAKSLENVNVEKLGAIGFSLGASAAIYAGVTQVFKALVLEGVFADSYDVGEEILIRRFGRNMARIIGYGFFWVGTMIWTLGQYRHARPVEFIAKVSPTPVMIIRGTDDERAPSHSAQLILEAVKQPSEIWIHKSGHTQAYTRYPKEYRQRVLDFLNTYL
jgi:uncharacterized protein